MRDEEPGEPPGPGRNSERDFHGERRENDTDASTIDPDAVEARRSRRSPSGKHQRQDRRSLMPFETIRARVAAGTLLAAFLTAVSVPALAAPTKNIVLAVPGLMAPVGSPSTRSSYGTVITSASFRSH
jgi:hypothetical protein